MKQVILDKTLCVSDDFKKGDCKHCPLGCYYDNGLGNYGYSCKVGHTPNICPIEFVEINVKKVAE